MVFCKPLQFEFNEDDNTLIKWGQLIIWPVLLDPINCLSLETGQHKSAHFIVFGVSTQYSYSSTTEEYEIYSSLNYLIVSYVDSQHNSAQFLLSVNTFVHDKKFFKEFISSLSKFYELSFFVCISSYYTLWIYTY